MENASQLLGGENNLVVEKIASWWIPINKILHKKLPSLNFPFFETILVRIELFKSSFEIRKMGAGRLYVG
jgi:hypothetical protein